MTLKDDTIDRNQEYYPKFRTKAGLLTPYSYACGYINICEFNDNNRITMGKDGCWFVKGFVCGARIWDVFDTLSEARKLYNKHRKTIKANQ